MDLHKDHDRLADPVKAVVEQYREIAEAVLSDAEIWLRQGELSRAIPEAMPDAILVTDENGCIVSVNAQFELMFGYHRSEVIGKLPEILMPEPDRAGHVSLRQAYANAPRVRDMAGDQRILARRKNGSEFRVQVKLAPVIISAGLYTIAVIRTIRD